MRLLILLLVLSTTYAKNAGGVIFSPSTHANMYEDLPSEALHVRFKRAVYAAIGISSDCEAGWTGQFCENPVCSGKPSTPSIPNASNQVRLVDQLHLPSQCAGKYYVPMDAMSSSLIIQVSADGNPYINLTDVHGNLITGAGGVYPGGAYATYNALYPGGYQLTIDNGGVPTQYCTVTIEAVSSVAVASGFSMSPQTDVLPQDESALSGVPMYFVAHVANVTTPGQVKAVTFRNSNSMTPVYRSLLTTRYGCGYEFYAGQYSCTSGTTYTAHIDGVDSYGYAFRRSSVFSCINPPPVTTTPKPTTPPLSVCYNNGTLLRANTPDASCFCTELFTGPQCQLANCMNNGYPTPSGLTCICPDGFWGDNCQHVTCDPNWGAFLTDKKTLVVVVRNTASMAPYINMISSAIQTQITQYQLNGQDVYNGYLLVTFANNDYQSQLYRSYDNFNTALTALNQSTIQGGCSDVTFAALYSVFVEYVYEKSPIYFFSDAIASDVNDWRSVTESNSRRKLPIYTFFTPQPTCNFDTLSQGYQSIVRAAQFSSGMSFMPTQSGNLNVLFTRIISATTYKMNQVAADDMLKCNTNGYRTFMIDSSADVVVIIATGNNLLFTLTDPFWTNNVAPIYSDNYNYVWEVPSTMVGEYLYTLQTTNQQDACSIRVMARSNYDLYFGTSSAVYVDAMDSEPVVGTPVHLVAQLNGLVKAVADPFRLFAELTITTNMNTDGQNIAQKPMYYSSGIYRDDCGYSLYFGVANFCEFADQQFFATVFADDSNGFTIQRTTIGYCSLAATTVEPSTTCQNGGVTDPTNNATCICRAGYSGDYCQNIQCQNGGTPYGSLCQCAVGTAGTFCELYSCPIANPSPQVSIEGKSMAWVVSTRSTMQNTWNQLASGVADFVRDCQTQSSTWITTWVLVVVNQNDALVVVESTVAQDFVNGVLSVAGNMSAFGVPGNTDCPVQLELGMYYSILYSQPRSQIYVFADSDGPDSNFGDIFDKINQYQITINMIATSNGICTAPENNNTFPAYLQDLAYASSGFVYMTPNVMKFLPVLVSSYKSSLAGQVGYYDCSTPITAYIPVDGWTQSFTVATTGGNVTAVTVTLPDGTPGINSPYEIQILNDPYLNLVQFISACQTGWNYHLQYCYLVKIQKMSWTLASQYCHSQSSALSDVFNQDKDNYIHTQTQGAINWIGLIRINGQWMWDVPDNTHYITLDPSYTKWCPTADVNNTNLNCVAMAADGCWMNMDCDTENYFMCQKHRYGQGIYPGESTNLLPGGRWRIDIQSNTGGCYAQIRAQSEIQIFFGFVQDPHNDFPMTEANALSQTNYLLAYTAGLAPFSPDTNPSLEGRLNYALLGYNNSLTTPLVMNDRWFCGYPMISQAFSCPQDGYYTDFFVKFTGIDQYGYAFDRYSDAVCKTFTASCFNGGFANNGKCVCAAGWTGDRCLTPICQNGQYSAADNKCVCEPMFTGSFCDIPYCEPPYPATFKDTGRTLVIMLETSYNMGSTIFQMKRNLKKSLDSINTDPSTAGWFSNFILYPFDSTSNMASWYPVVSSTNSDDIVAAVKNITTMSCPGTGACSTQCPRPIMGVLGNVLARSDFAKPNSAILVVTRSSPEDFESARSLTQSLQESRVQLNYIYPAVDSPCSEGWNTPAAAALYRTTFYSDGNVFVMSAVDFSINFMQTYVPSLYRSAGLETGSSNQCGSQEVLFQVENGMYDFTIDYYTPVTNPPVTVTLIDPAGDQIPLPPNLISSDSNYLGIVKVNTSGVTRAGTYSLTLTGGQSNFCMLNLRGRSSVELYPAYAPSTDGFNGATADNAYYAPSLYANNTIVVHADGLGLGSLTYAQVVVPLYGLQHVTPLKQRDGACSYQWYGTIPFECLEPTFLLVVYGLDAQGAVIRRKYIASCVSNVPRPPPPPAKCDLTKVMQDTLFILDSSMMETNNTFYMFQQLASNSQMPYRLSPNFTQVGAFTLADKAYAGFGFTNATTFAALNNLFMSLQYSGMAGQNMTSGFQSVLNNYESTAQGRRSGSGIRHLIMYITSSNPTDADPNSLLYGIRRGGLYGLAILGYNMTASTQLSGMVTDDCMYISPNLNDFHTSGLNFIQQLSCTRVPRCGM